MPLPYIHLNQGKYPQSGKVLLDQEQDERSVYIINIHVNVQL